MNEVIDAIRKVIEEQSAFRTIYDYKCKVVHELEYSDWYIPVIEESQYAEVEKDCIKLYENGGMFKNKKQQSYLILIKKGDGKYRLFLYINHAFFDGYSRQIFKDRIDYYLKNKGVLVEEKYFSEYNKILLQQTMEQKNNQLISEMLDEMLIDKTETYFSKISQEKGFAYVMELKLGLDKELKERFEANIIGALVKIYVKFNPRIQSCANIPYNIVHNGRNEQNRDLVGLTLRVNPGVYNVFDNSNLGGLDEKILNITALDLFSKVGASSNPTDYINKMICINYRGLYFVGEVSEKRYAEKRIESIHEWDEQIGGLVADYSTDGMILQIPLFGTSYDYVNSLNEEELLDIVKTCIMD